MQDAEDPGPGPVAGYPLQAGFGKPAHPDQPRRIENFDDPQQVGIAGCFHRGHLRSWNFVRGAVASGLLQKNQGAIIHHKKVFEELLRSAELIRRPAPEPPAADLAALAAEPFHRPLGMFCPGRLHRGLDPHPVPHCRHFPKGHPGLGHAERSRIHPEKEALFFPGPELPQVGLVRRPGVIQRMIDMGHGQRKRQGPQDPAQRVGGGSQGIGGGGHPGP